MKMLVGLCFVGLCVGLGEGFVIEALHDHMTESELAYYFETGDKNAIPEYEVVNLPNVELSSDEDTFHYEFDAFQR